MSASVDIVVKNVESTEAIQSRIQRNVEKLPLFHNNIEFCKVIVDVPQKHKYQGKLFTVHIEIGVPKKRLVVNRKVDENLYIAIREAFAAMKRQLDEYNHKQKNHIKQHPETLRGKITRLYSDYGFIESSDGREFYFNESSLLHPDFEAVDIGTPVHFLESLMDDGLQAVHISANSNAIEKQES